MKNRVKQVVFHEKSVSLSLLIILNVTKNGENIELC